MALLSTVRYGSTLGQAEGTGNYGGDLHLFFTKLNPADVIQLGGHPTWAKWAISDVYNLPNGTVTLNLNVVNDGGPPFSLVMVGTIGVQTSDEQSFNSQEIGAGGALFAPDAPQMSLFNGSRSGSTTDGKYTLGFELNVAWDGVSADCVGSWWAIWD